MQASLDRLLIAIAVVNAATGLYAFGSLAQMSFGGDVDFLRRGAAGWLAGVPVADFVYSPVAAMLAVPLTWIPFELAAMIVALLATCVLAAGLIAETRGVAPWRRMLIGIAVLGFLPVVNELLLGQITLFIAASILPLRSRDSLVAGVPLGIVLAIAPKPMLIPLLVWMVVRRRRSLVGSAMGAAAVTLVGVAIAGVSAYGWWLAALAEAGRISRDGNLSVWRDGPTPVAIAVAIVAVATMVWLIVRDDEMGFVGAVVGGLLLAPYTLAYAVSIVLIAVRPLAARARVGTGLLALTGSVGVLYAFPIWASVTLGAALTASARSATTEHPPQATGRSPATTPNGRWPA